MNNFSFFLNHVLAFILCGLRGESPLDPHSTHISPLSVRRSAHKHSAHLHFLCACDVTDETEMLSKKMRGNNKGKMSVIEMLDILCTWRLAHVDESH